MDTSILLTNMAIEGSISGANGNQHNPEQTHTRSTPPPGLGIRYIPTSDLIQFTRNARTHSKAQIRKIAASIQEFGFTNPILIDRGQTVIAGHGRVAAAKLLGMRDVPTICLENLTPAQVRAYVIADNRLAEDAGWDAEILKIELQNIVLEGAIDISLTGFEIPEIDILLGEPPAEDDPADSLPEVGSEVSELGDLWVLGEHRIFCGDARDQASFERLMEGRKAGVVFTDPPYNVRIEGHVSGNGRVKHKDFAMAVGEMLEAEFTQFLEQSLSVLTHNSTPGSVHFVCMDWRHMGEVLAAGKKTYGSLLNLCVWAKNSGGMGSFYRSRHELVFVFRHGETQHRNNIQLGRFGRDRTNVWEYPGISALSGRQDGEGNLLALHPTVKPVALVSDAILDCSARGDIVLDSFLGSGSTLLSAERTRRICYGIELNPQYVDIAIERWQRYTGENAVHSGTGQTFAERMELGRG